MDAEERKCNSSAFFVSPGSSRSESNGMAMKREINFLMELSGQNKSRNREWAFFSVHVCCAAIMNCNIQMVSGRIS